MEESKSKIIVVIGDTGQGKSTLINCLLGQDLAPTGDFTQMKGVTKNITAYHGKLFSSSLEIEIYDTPGLGGQQISAYDLLDIFEEKFAGKEIDYVVYVQRLDEYRLREEAKLGLQLCAEIIMNKNGIKTNLIIILTHKDKVNDDVAASYTKAIINEVAGIIEVEVGKVFCFEKDSPNKSLTSFADYISSNTGRLQIKADVTKEVYEKIVKQEPKRFLGEKEEITQKVPTNPFNKKCTIKYEVTFIGNAAVGKTSLIQRLTGQPKESILHTIPTIGYDSTKKIVSENIIVRYWDTCGQERYQSIVPSLIKHCYLIFLVFRIDEIASFLQLNNWVTLIKNHAMVNSLVYLIGNCDDLEKKVDNDLIYAFLVQNNIKGYFEVSCLTSSNLELLDNVIVKNATEYAKKKYRHNQICDKINLNQKSSQWKANCWEKFKTMC